jgi:probable phosphoglycerate mutase
MTRFVLIRHAATDAAGTKIAGRADGGPLNELGRSQAGRLAERLAAMETIAAVYSSPQKRARETAGVLADALRITAQVATALDELDYGEWTDRTIAELQTVSEWRAFNTIRSCAPIPGGESILRAQCRMIGFIEQLQHSHLDQSVALVSHAETIRAALTYYLGVPLDLMLRLEIAPASLSLLELDEHGPLLRSINSTEFLWF